MSWGEARRAAWTETPTPWPGWAPRPGLCPGRPHVDKLGWPAAIMTTAFMPSSGASRSGGLVGHAIQWGPDNPRMQTCFRGGSPPVRRGPLDVAGTRNPRPSPHYLAGPWFVDSLHRATVLPSPASRDASSSSASCSARDRGPTHPHAGGPYDNQLFKGDWCCLRSCPHTGSSSRLPLRAPDDY